MSRRTLVTNYDLLGYHNTKLRYRLAGQREEIPFSPDDGHILTPRIAAAYEIAKGNIVKLSYQEGFHYPAFASFLGEGESFSDLSRERMKSFEGGWQIALPRRNLTIALSLYYNIYEDSILRGAPDEGEDNGAALLPVEGEVDNSDDDFAAVGGELSAAWTPDHRTRVHLSYGYARPVGAGIGPVNHLWPLELKDA